MGDNRVFLAPSGAGKVSEEDLADELIARLNSILESLDEDGRASIQRLIDTRVPCSSSVLDHPTIQARAGEPPTFGFLGMLNGLVGVDETSWGLISVEVDKTTGRVERFSRTSPPGSRRRSPP